MLKRLQLLREIRSSNVKVDSLYELYQFLGGKPNPKTSLLDNLTPEEQFAIAERISKLYSINHASIFVKKAADRGNMDAIFNCAQLISKGKWPVNLLPVSPSITDFKQKEASKMDPIQKRAREAENRRVAMSMIRPLAEKGHAKANYVVALDHIANGKLRKAFECILLAADGGVADAQHHLGLLYQEGLGYTSINPMKARHYIKLASGQGNVEATSRLSQYNLDGYGSEEGKADMDAAFTLSLKAATAGNANAQHNLAQLYIQGPSKNASGVEGQPLYERNHLYAIEYLKMASQQNWIPSIVGLGSIYEKGFFETDEGGPSKKEAVIINSSS